MGGREVRDYTNLSDPRDKRWNGKGSKEKVDEEDLAFKKMVAKMQDVAGDRGGYLHGRGALDSDDILYLKEQMEAESNAERLRRRTEKKAFAAFKKAASLADSSHSSMIPALRMEPKPRSGIRQQDLLKNIVEVKAKRHHVDVPTQDVAKNTNVQSSSVVQVVEARANSVSRNDHPINSKNAGALLGLTYESSDDESEDLEDAKQGQVVQATVLNHDSG